jgi:hypothetical protein
VIGPVTGPIVTLAAGLADKLMSSLSTLSPL